MLRTNSQAAWNEVKGCKSVLMIPLAGYLKDTKSKICHRTFRSFPEGFLEMFQNQNLPNLPALTHTHLANSQILQ